MSLTWSSIGHAFASGFSGIARGATFLVNQITKIEGSEKTVEGLSGLVPILGPTIVKYEQLAYAGLGMLAAGLHYGGDAFEKNLLDNGSDQAAIDEIKKLITEVPELLQQIESVFGKPGANKAPALTPASAAGVTSSAPGVPKL